MGLADLNLKIEFEDYSNSDTIYGFVCQIIMQFKINS